MAPKPEGAFYLSVVFEDGVLNEKQSLGIKNQKIENFISKEVNGLSPDKRFVYYLMAVTGICVVPLSGFNSNLYGFRITLLEPNEDKFKEILKTISSSIKEYLT